MTLRILLIAFAVALASTAAAPQPNIVLFLQDDQDRALGGWEPMTKASKLLVDHGAEATNWFIHTPVCCPSRAELLSGRYFHNVREPVPKGGCMHVDEDKVNPDCDTLRISSIYPGIFVAWIF